MVADGPTAVPADVEPAAERVIGSLMRLVTEVRRFRADQGLRPSQAVPAIFEWIAGSALGPHEASIRALLRLTAPAGDFSPNASGEAEGLVVRLDTSSGIDVAAQRRRLTQELTAGRAEAQVSERKLSHQSFLS